MTKFTKLTRIIQGELVYRETAVKPKRRKRLSNTFYRNRSVKGWETRKRQKQARLAATRAAKAEDKRAA